MDFASATGRFPTDDSPYFRFLRAEQEEVAKVKWCESEKLGHDCGQDYAVWIWSMRYRTKWIASLKARGLFHFTQ